MIRSGFFACLVLWAFAAPVFAQGKSGVFGPLESTPEARKEGRDALRPPSNPGIAAPLDIRIQGEGLSLPPGVSEDAPVSKPAEDRAPPQRSPAPENPSPPGAKRP